MRTNLSGESLGTALVSGVAAIGTGYLMTSWQKAAANQTAPFLTNVLLAPVGIGAALHTRPGYLHETLEAVGYTAAGNFGTWMAEATTTIGGKGPGAPAFFTPKSTTTTSGAVVARRAARRAAQVGAIRVVPTPANLPPAPAVTAPPTAPVIAPDDLYVEAY